MKFSATKPVYDGEPSGGQVVGNQPMSRLINLASDQQAIQRAPRPGRYLYLT